MGQLCAGQLHAHCDRGLDSQHGLIYCSAMDHKNPDFSPLFSTRAALLPSDAGGHNSETQLTGGGQGSCSASHQAQDSPAAKGHPARVTVQRSEHPAPRTP